jgi:hypothetical protein
MRIADQPGKSEQPRILAALLGRSILSVILLHLTEYFGQAFCKRTQRLYLRTSYSFFFGRSTTLGVRTSS